MAQQDLDFGTGAANDGETLFAGFTKVQANFDELYGIVDGSRLTLTQGTITDPATMFSGSVTWNDVNDTFVGWSLAVTDTASADDSQLIKATVGATTVFAVEKYAGGGIRLTSTVGGQELWMGFEAGVGNQFQTWFRDSLHHSIYWDGVSVGQSAVLRGHGTNRLSIESDAAITFIADTATYEFEALVANGGSELSFIAYTAASAIGRSFNFNNQGHTPTTADVLYASTYDRAYKPFAARFQTTNMAWIDGYGSLVVSGQTVTTALPVLDLSRTWNAGGVTFTGIKLNVTDSASAADSKLFDAQVGSNSIVSMEKGATRSTIRANYTNGTPRLQFGILVGDANYAGGWFGNVTASDTNYSFLGDGSTYLIFNGPGASGTLLFRRNHSDNIFALADHASLQSSAVLQWCSTDSAIGTADTGLIRSEARVVEVNNGTAGTLGDLKARALVTPVTSELTIASGVITVTGSKHRVDTQADDPTDDLDTINGGVDGMIVTLRAENDGRTVVVKDGSGNIQIAGDMTLDNTQDTITLQYDLVLTSWLEIGRAASGA